MKYVSTIETKDYTLVITRLANKVDGEYHMFGNLFLKNYQDRDTQLVFYPRTLSEGTNQLTDMADRHVAVAYKDLGFSAAIVNVR